MEIKILDITPNAESLIEDIARVCYQSTPKEGYVQGKLIENLLKSNPPHETPLEHAKATVKISGVSRSLTHQLVRHRLCSFMQLSQRYVDSKDFSYVIPSSIYEKGLETEFKNDMELIGKMYEKYRDAGVLREDARYVLPNACETEIVVTANFREWRNIFKLRCDKHAQWEIRELCRAILYDLYHHSPHVFQDLFDKFFEDELKHGFTLKENK